MADTQLTSLEQVKVGDFVKFVDRDKSGKFSYTGKVISIRKENRYQGGMFEMLTIDAGILGFSFPRVKKNEDEVRTVGQDEVEANELYLTTTKPKGWAKFEKNPDSFKEQRQEEEKVIPAKPKKEQVFDLVKANPRKREAALLKLAMKEIGGSKTQLQNYIKLALSKK